MAERGSQEYSEKFCCSVCLELLKDPVTPTCGHSYCRNCIKDHWDSEEHRGVYSCPQCRKTFIPRPELETHVQVAELVEELKKTGLQAAPVDHCSAPADHCSAGPEDVTWHVFTWRKVKALKSFFFWFGVFGSACLAFYCGIHLNDVSPLMKHKLEELQENICPHHNEVMKLFCRTDQQPICYLCSVDQHKGHDIVSAAAERSERQKELEETRLKIQQRVQDTEGDVKLLQQEVEAIRGSADAAVEESDQILTQMINDLQRRSSEVKQQIRSQQETEELRVKELQENLEQEIAELKRRDTELEQLALTQDHNKFLQDYTSLPTLAPSTHLPRTRTRPLSYFEDLTAAVSQVRGQIQNILTQASTYVSLTLDQVDVLLTQPEPERESRDNFLKYSQEIKLDPNTAHKRLIITDGNRKVTHVEEEQSYPDHPDRFTHWPQVLSRESLTGRRYWEVEVRRGTIGVVRVAVSYKNISRAGHSMECGFGNNDKSWALFCCDISCYFIHNSILTPVSGPIPTRVGVYLDHSAGVLSFYSVSDTMTLIHRVRTTFTQPLHAGVEVGPGSSAEFCKLK